jgi:hypothetical protein
MWLRKSIISKEIFRFEFNLFISDFEIKKYKFLIKKKGAEI